MRTKTKIHTDVRPEIGVLMRNGGAVYYAFIDGKKHERSNPCAMANWIWTCRRRGSKIGS